MKTINLIIFLVVLASSCNTKKNATCDAYSKTIKVPYQDTIIMSSLHYHFEEEHACVWVKCDTNVYNDTIYLDIYEKK